MNVRGIQMRLRKRRTVIVGFAFLSIMAFSQLYDTIVPLILDNSFNMTESQIGLFMAIDNVLAIFLMPLFGVASDKTSTRLGKRTPYIIIGCIASCIAMYFMPFYANRKDIAMFFIVTFIVLISMAFFRTPAVALMPDITPRPLRSKGNAVINLMGTVGAIYTLIMIKILVPNKEKPDYSPLFVAVIVFMLIATVVFTCFVSEKKWEKKAREVEAEAGIGEIDENEEERNKGVKLEKGKLISLIFLLLSVAFWFFAYNGVTTMFTLYYQNYWNIEGGDFADCLLIATVAATIALIPIVFFATKIGRKRSIFIGIIMTALGYGYVAVFTQYSPLVNIGFVIIGVGWAMINVNSLPMVVEIASDGDVGRYTGFYYTFSMAAQVLTPFLAGRLMEKISYRLLFPYAVVFSAAAFVSMLFVKHGDVKPAQKKSILESFDVDD